MSGIVGVFFRNGRPVERRLVQQMIAAVSHRGPDGTGLWCQGSVGLGHVLLQTSPESGQARLPVTSRNGALVLTADVRLDNRAELTHALACDSPQESPRTDSQLILAAYEKWGLDCAARLLGDFAFAIWDANERRLVCVRDHMGVKPLYNYVRPHVFAFASEMRALWCLPEVPRQVNEVRVAEYLAVLESEDKQATFYRDIQRLPNAQHLSVTSDKCQCQTYWALNPERQIQLPSNEAYAEHFQQLFTEAVRCRLSPSAPAGSILEWRFRFVGCHLRCPSLSQNTRRASLAYAVGVF